MYQSGTIASVDGPRGLLQALAPFAASAGWTINNNAASGGGWWLSLQKGDCFVSLFSDNTNKIITLYGATGFVQASGPSGQPQTTTGPAMVSSPTPGSFVAGQPFDYHAFSTPSARNLHVFVETTPGLFCFFALGALSASGGGAPKTYVSVTNWYSVSSSYNNPDYQYNTVPFGHCDGWGTTRIGLTVDGTFRWFMAVGTTPARAIMPVRGGGFNQSMFRRTPNAFNGMAPMIPLPVFVERADGGYSYVGEPVDLRVISLANLLPKEEFTLGGDTWKVFPFLARQTGTVATGTPSSGTYGYAVKK